MSWGRVVKWSRWIGGRCIIPSGEREGERVRAAGEGTEGEGEK